MSRWPVGVIAASTVFLALAGCSTSATEVSDPVAVYSGVLDGTIMLTDDDGWDAPGITALYDVLSDEGYDVVLVAPLENQSGTSASLTTAPTLTVTQPTDDPNVWAVDGTPADSALVGLTGVLTEAPSLVVSGINIGYNLGDDLNYSGTVGAAVAASLQGVPSVAISATAPAEGVDPYDDYVRAAKFLAALLSEVGESEGSWPVGSVLNVNYPTDGEPRGVMFTTVADTRGMSADYDPDDGGVFERSYVPDHSPAAGTDLEAVAAGYISVGAISANRGSAPTDYAALAKAVGELKP